MRLPLFDNDSRTYVSRKAAIEWTIPDFCKTAVLILLPQQESENACEYERIYPELELPIGVAGVVENPQSPRC